VSIMVGNEQKGGVRCKVVEAERRRQPERRKKQGVVVAGFSWGGIKQHRNYTKVTKGQNTIGRRRSRKKASKVQVTVLISPTKEGKKEKRTGFLILERNSGMRCGQGKRRKSPYDTCQTKCNGTSPRTIPTQKKSRFIPFDAGCKEVTKTISLTEDTQNL